MIMMKKGPGQDYQFQSKKHIYTPHIIHVAAYKLWFISLECVYYLIVYSLKPLFNFLDSPQSQTDSL